MQFLKHRRLTTFVLSLAVLFYAVPKLQIQWDGTLSSVFAFVWLGFAMLVVAANWRATLGIDKEEANQLERIKRLKRWQREEWIHGRRSDYPREGRRKAYQRDLSL